MSLHHPPPSIPSCLATTSTSRRPLLTSSLCCSRALSAQNLYNPDDLACAHEGGGHTSTTLSAGCLSCLQPSNVLQSSQCCLGLSQSSLPNHCPHCYCNFTHASLHIDQAALHCLTFRAGLPGRLLVLQCPAGQPTVPAGCWACGLHIVSISAAQCDLKHAHLHTDWQHLEGCSIFCRLPGRLPAQQCTAE